MGGDSISLSCNVSWCCEKGGRVLWYTWRIYVKQLFHSLDVRLQRSHYLGATVPDFEDSKDIRVFLQTKYIFCPAFAFSFSLISCTCMHAPCTAPNILFRSRTSLPSWCAMSRTTRLSTCGPWAWSPTSSFTATLPSGPFPTRVPPLVLPGS